MRLSCFLKSTNIRQFEIKIGSHVIPQTTIFNYLGVFFDIDLGWRWRYTVKISSKISRIHLACFCCTPVQQLCRRLIGFFMEYGSVYCTKIGKTHVGCSIGLFIYLFICLFANGLKSN
jgi:hypothetical protein